MKQAIHQLVHTLSYGDAISSEVLSLKRVFESLGFESKIFSLHTHPKLEGLTEQATNLPEDFNGQLILHYSLGSPLNTIYSAATKAKRSIIYHNLTPSHWFEGINPRITADIRAGEAELPALLRLSDMIIADSTFNAEELKKLGFNATVLPLPIDPNRWQVEANEGIKKIVSGTKGPHLVHVGRLAPNKCIEDIIRAFYFFRHFIKKDSRLWLVGIDIDTELYSFSLRHMVDQLGLRDAVEFPGCLADSELRALYEEADLYICMSEHEGFCLPVIEAMHFGLPVIAYASSALPETISDGGILVEDKDPAMLAALFEAVLDDQTLKKQIIKAGQERVKALSYDNFSARTVEIFFSEDSSLSKVQDAYCA